MTTQLRLLAVATLTLIAALAAWCYPTLYGDTGLVQVPTSDVVPYTFLSIAINYTEPDNTLPGTQGRFNIFPTRITYGVGTGSEMSFFDSIATGTGNSKFNVIGGGLKCQILKEDPFASMPGVAFGARAYRMEMPTERDVVEAYGVVSKTLLASDNLIDKGFAIRAHLGASYTNFSGDVKANCPSFFVGVSYKQASGVIVDVDYLPKLQSDGEVLRSSTASVAVRYPFSEDSSFEIGTTKAYGSDQSSIYIGFSVMYGNRSDLATREPVLE